MKRFVLQEVVSVLVLTVGVASVLAAPPRVVRVTPEHGEDLVDPALAELRVEFDQPMTAGASWVGGGESFPTVTAPPRWETTRTCVLPVTMRPDHVYRLGINGGRFMNFRSVAGPPAIPHPVVFRTGPADPAVRAARAAAAPDAATHRASVAALRDAIATRYAHRGRLGIDWNGLFDQREDHLASSTSAFQFAARAAQALAPARDVHIWIVADDETLPSHRRDVEWNIDIQSLPRRLDGARWSSRTVLTGRIDGVPYIGITSFESSVAAALDAIREHHAARAMIIDVRANAGGDETRARRVAGCFVSEPVVYARHRTVDPGAPGGFTGVFDRALEPTPGVPRFEGEVIVLTGPACMSSGEAFLLMMKQVDRCTLLGMTSYGSSGNPKPIGLPNGVAVFLPSWQALTPDGAAIEGRGVDPDVLVKTTAADFAAADPVLDAALMRLGR